MERLQDIPLFPLNTVLFPGVTLPLHIFEDRYRRMVARCLEEHLPFGVVLAREGTEVGTLSEPFSIGTLAHIVQSQQLPDGRFRLVTMGTQRFQITGLSHEHPYLTGDIATLERALPGDTAAREAIEDMAHTVGVLYGEYFRLTLVLAEQWQESVALPSDPLSLADYVASRIVAPTQLKQRILEAHAVQDCLELELGILSEAIPMLSAGVREKQQRRWASIFAIN